MHRGTSLRWLALGCALWSGGCGLHEKRKVERKASIPPPASSAHAEAARPGEVVAPGIVEPWEGEVLLSAPEPGRVARILVDEGQRVAEGELLAELDDAPQLAAVALAKAELAEAAAGLDKALRGPTSDERRQARAEARSTEARAELARREAQRAERLGRGDALSAADVERASSEAEIQAAVAQASAARLGGVERGARAEDRLIARQRQAAAEARLELAEANLARRRVAAPAAATVLLSRYHAGEFVSGQAPLFVLGDTSRLRVRLEVDEIDATRVAEGAKCVITGDDGAPLGAGRVLRLAQRMGRRALATEAPTARADVRVREVFVEVRASEVLLPGRRVWGRVTPREAMVGSAPTREHDLE
jgi:multidrug efflux pump subunit AcrA (membrane-fusion protein)